MKSNKKNERLIVTECRKYQVLNLTTGGSLQKTQMPVTSPVSNSESSLKTEEWMTTKEAAEFLRIPRVSLLNLSSNGKIPYYKFQRRNRYLKSDLSQLLLSNRRGGFDGN